MYSLPCSTGLKFGYTAFVLKILCQMRIWEEIALSFPELWLRAYFDKNLNSVYSFGYPFVLNVCLTPTGKIPFQNVRGQLRLQLYASIHHLIADDY